MTQKQHGEQEQNENCSASYKVNFSWLREHGARLVFLDGSFMDGAPDELDTRRTVLGYRTHAYEWLCVPCWQHLRRPAISPKKSHWQPVTLGEALDLPRHLHLSCDLCCSVFWDRGEALIERKRKD